MPSRRGAMLVALVCMLFGAGAVRAEAPPSEGGLPPRFLWHAECSSAETAAMAAAFAIDGDATTRWGGAFTAEHWLQVDLGSVADLGGVLIHWDSGFAASYRILTSVDGEQWQASFETRDGRGGFDYVFFPRVLARYVRLASVPLSADWGVSVFELEPLAASQAARIEGLPLGDDAATLWGGEGAPKPRALGPSRTVTIQLPRPLFTTGLEVYWEETGRTVWLDARDDRGRWRTLATDAAPFNEKSLLAGRKPVMATALRLRVAAAGGKPPAIRRLHLLPPDRTMTPLRRYEVVAAGSHRALFPLSARNQQVYWTAVGIPMALQKSIFDEFGNLEAWKGAPMVQPLWRSSDRQVHAAFDAGPQQSLRDGFLPMPAVQWSPQPDVLVRSEAIAVEHGGQPVTLLRHRVENTGESALDGELVLLVRPIQINPAWQSGGTSPIREIAVQGPLEDTVVRVNGRSLLRSLTPVGGRGASGFGERGEDELTQRLAWDRLPATLKASDDDALAAAYLTYPLHLEPREKRDVVLAFPLGKRRIDVLASGSPEEPPPIDRATLLPGQGGLGEAFDALGEEVAEAWEKRLGTVSVVLPDRGLTDMFRAQIAYMMINQAGNAIQPGPRNYNRSFIRDGSATAVVMLRMGLPHIARDYLRWYTDHALHENGLVSPILNDDGSVNDGFGADLEHDSQGQFVAFIAEVARLDGGPEKVRSYLPKVRLALQFLQELRERTMVPDYKADAEVPERFHGIIAPSISHEGYPVPTHSYWDDFWALKGWRDGSWLAASLGDIDMAIWAREQYELLRDSVIASIDATMRWRGIATVPASADRGEGDPTSVSIALDPCGEQSVLSLDALKRTFDAYLEGVRQREKPGTVWAFTPYELRNVLTYVHLNRPADAYELLEYMLKYRRPEPWQMFAEVVHSRPRHPVYLGDMPHTWIGAEYVRLILGMLMREETDQLELLPGAPPAWVSGEGLSVSDLRTAHGRLSMTARRDGPFLKVLLAPGIDQDVAVRVSWPNRVRPSRVWVDGLETTDYTADGIRVTQPFYELEAKW